MNDLAPAAVVQRPKPRSRSGTPSYVIVNPLAGTGRTRMSLSVSFRPKIIEPAVYDISPAEYMREGAGRGKLIQTALQKSAIFCETLCRHRTQFVSDQ